jgi:flagellin
MRINQNIMAFNAYRNLSATNGAMGKSLEKLSSGFRINRAADDAAGLVISQNLRAQVSGLKQATRNAQDGISVVQTAEGALVEVHSMLNRMRDLAVQAANTGSNDPAAQAAAQEEVDALIEEIDRIAGTTRFGGINLLDGAYGAAATAGSAVGSAIDTTAGGGIGDDLDQGAFLLQLDGGSWLTVQLPDTAAAGDINTAAELQSALETSVNTALTDAGLDPAHLTVTVTGTDAAAVVNITRSGTGSLGADAGVRLALAPGSTALTDIGITNGASAFATGGGGVFQVGANNGDTINVETTDVRVTGGSEAAMTALATVDLTTDAAGAIDAFDDAIEHLSTVRGELGAYQNRFEATIANLQVTTENLSASESRIRDTDMALEMVSFTRSNILQQAGTAMLAQANQLPQSVLRLLG